MELDLRLLLRIARRWMWLLILIPVAAGSLAFVSSSRQTPMYSSSALIRINPPANALVDLSALQLSQKLGETYRMLIVTEPVLQNVVDILDLSYSVNQLRNNVSATAVSDTQLVRITVTDPNADTSALIANTVASEFVRYVSEESRYLIEGTLAGLADQANALESELIQTDEAIRRVSGMSDPVVQAELEALQAKRTQLQQQIISVQTQMQAVSVGMVASQTQVTVSELAKPPSQPYSPTPRTSLLLGGFVGALLAAGVIALLEFLDNSVKSDTSIPDLIGVPLLSSIREVPSLPAGGQQVVVISKPLSPAAETIRLLRANLDFVGAGQPVRAIAVTSSGPGEGKSTVSANLAVASAQSGLRTLLVDADLRKPTQHQIFGIPNDLGLSLLLTQPDLPWEKHAVKVAVPNLQLLPSEPIPPNPADLLALGTFARLLDLVGQDVDLVIVDTPPVLAVSDPVLIARHTDGVLLLARANRTKLDALTRSAESVNQAGIRLLGVVLNQVSATSDDGYAYYYEGEKGPREIPMDSDIKRINLTEQRA